MEFMGRTETLPQGLMHPMHLWTYSNKHRQQRLLRMQAVLGLIEHDRRRAVHDARADFLAAMRGEAVHEDRVRARRAP